MVLPQNLQTNIAGRANPSFYNNSMLNLTGAHFYTSAAKWTDLPSTYQPEVCFAGRSNAGKSTAINLLVNQKRLAFASKTPGRTRLINYFALPGTDPDTTDAFLVDLPGYGYAEVPQTEKAHWQRFLGEYVARRAQIAGLMLIMDARRPFTDLDLQLIAWFGVARKPVHALLTKADKLNRNEQTNTLRAARVSAAKLAGPLGIDFTLQLFSSLKRVGLEEATTVLNDWMAQKRTPTT